MQEIYPYYLANKAEQPNADLIVTNKYTGEPATRVVLADATAIERAIAKALEAAAPLRRMAPFERQAVLIHCVKRFCERFDKLADAIAAGCPFVLKPASLTPVGALLIGEILAETDLPPGAFSILPCARGHADPFTTDHRLKLLSFTGSPDVGWVLKEKAGKKKVVLDSNSLKSAIAGNSKPSPT